MNKNNIHIRISYRTLKKILPIAEIEGTGVELFMSSYYLDKLPLQDLHLLSNSSIGDNNFSLHAPFMDLSPGGMDEKVRNVTIERIITSVRTVSEFNPKPVVVHPGYGRFKFNGQIEGWLNNSISTWEKILEECPYSIFAIENVFEDTPDLLMKLVKNINSKRFGICFDIGHFNLFSGITIEEWIEKIYDNILEFHLHDNNGFEDQHFGLGKGKIDLDKFFDLISKIGNNPIYTLESHTHEGIIESLNFFKERGLID